ncbi:MAG: hypothetical protein KBD64_01200 [Gammaproteobacteria bacterium]|nr:hypothetical protein [Gammaproteobacteria bacterium]
MNKLKFLAYILIIALLTGCGFQLRGWQKNKLIISNLKLDYSNINNSPINTNLVNNLIGKLRDNGIAVVSEGFIITTHTKETKSAEYTLELTSADYTKKIISTGSTQSVTQYKLTFNIIFRLFKKDKLVLNNQIIHAQRNYNYQQNQILGLNYEEETITNELIQEVADRIINQFIIAAT